MSERSAETRGREDWPSWLDRQRYWLGLIVFVIFFLLYGCLVFASGERKLSPLEQVSMALIGLVISAVFGVVLGMPLAKRRVKIASQLRRAYGIAQAVRSVQRDVEQATGRMKRRGLIADPKILGEFWDEIAQNIRTSLRGPLFEAERMVEDWSEMDPDERLRIQADEERKASEIEDLTRDIESARSVEKDLEGVEGRVSTTLATAVESLEQRIRELQEAQPSRLYGLPSGAARALLDKGQFREAVEAYNEIIRRSPNVHTNYIGRAKARYLAGDAAGALSDLETAKRMFADDPAIENLREQITAGKAVTAPLPSTAMAEAIAGNQALSTGNAVAAVDHYSKAEGLGFNPFFVRFNMGMVKCLQGAFPEAESILAELTADDGSYMWINALALRAICNSLKGESVDEILAKLRSHVDSSVYDYHRSPLRFLELGLGVASPARLAATDAVFETLRSGSRHQLMHWGSEEGEGRVTVRSSKDS